MHRWKMSGAATIVAGTLFATSVHAFDGNRKGFILGGGLGPGWTSFAKGYGDSFDGEDTSDRETKFGLATDFKIGGGINEKFMVYYGNRVSWFQSSGATTAHGIGLFGVSYYVDTSAPSMYFVGTVGVATWLYFSEDRGGYTGFGFAGGAGYEFAKHWSVEGVVTWANPGTGPLTIKAYSFLVTVSAIAY